MEGSATLFALLHRTLRCDDITNIGLVRYVPQKC